MSSAHVLGTSFACIALVLYAVSTLLTRLGMDRVETDLGFSIAVVMNVVVCAVAVVAQTWARTDPLTIDWRGFGVFVAAGFCSTFLGRWFLFESVARLGAGRASVFSSASPVFTVILAWVFLGERLSTGALAAILVTIVGLILVTDRGSASGSSPSTTRRAARMALLIGMLSGVAYAAGHVLRAEAVRGWNEPVLGALIGAASGTIAQLVTGAPLKDLLRRLGQANRLGVLLFALVGTANIVAQMLSIAAMKHLPASAVALITASTPLLVVPASHLLLKGERVTPRALGGLALTSVGVIYLLLVPAGV